MRPVTVPHTSHWGSFEAQVVHDAVVGLIPDEHDPEPTPVLRGVADALEADVRVRRPAVRESWLAGAVDGGERRPERRGGEPFVEVSWERALDLVAGELQRVREQHGNAAIFGGSYGWSSAGRFHHAKTQLHRFLTCFGGFTDQISNYSFGAAAAILPHVLGTASAASGELTSWDVLAEHTELFVLFGGIPLKNAQVESGGLSRHSTRGWLKTLKTRGTRFVAVTPQRDDAPEFLGAEWIAPRPNTDTAIMLGLAHTLFAEGLYDEDFLQRYCTGWDRFRRYLTGEDDGVAKTAAWAGAIADVDPAVIRSLAREMAVHRTMISVSWSLQRADHGEQPYWAAIALAALLGQIGLPGGGFGFAYGATGTKGNARYPFPAPVLPVGTNPVTGAIPAARIVDMLVSPGADYEFNGETRTYPDTRLVYWAGGNPFHHHQDLNRLIRAWQRPETVVVHEAFWTATARHADIVLPATTTLERHDIGAASHDGRIVAMKQAVPPRGEARNDVDIFTGLAERLGIAAEYTQGRDEMDWIRHLYETTRASAAEHGYHLPEFERFWADGSVEVPTGSHVLLGAFRDDPEANRLVTPSGRIELFSETIDAFGYDDCPGHPAWLEPSEWLGGASAERFGLHLLSNQPSARLHSQLDMAAASRDTKIAGREPCRLNPADAAARGIRDGDVVRIYNDRGSCLAGAVLSDALRRGVIHLPTGAWYQPAAPSGRGEPHALEIHGNPNVLTRDAGTSRLGQGAAAQTALVEVERYAQPAPEVSVTSEPPNLTEDGAGVETR
ncbi:molybdopterin-dependent oxidoreductase [Georgenia deserti]|uniref:Molybdopterin-dependent oxidoreductase n=1 Tax=Georgenia deserti TaxID=2093781 RepID=A0ABW4LA93_9MICO